MRQKCFALIVTVLCISLTACKDDTAQQKVASDYPASISGGGVRPLAAAPDDIAGAGNDAAPEDRRSVIVCYGDSLTAGYGADTGSSYPDFLQKDLDRAGYFYHVENEGISGNTTKDGVDRLPGIIARKPAIVVLEFGGNDGLRGLKIDLTRANLAQMIQTLQSAGAKVVLAGITLPPDYGHDYIAAFTAMYPQLARRYHVPLLPFLLKNVYGVPGMMQADRTHATEKGNEVVARNVFALLMPLLHKGTH